MSRINWRRTCLGVKEQNGLRKNRGSPRRANSSNMGLIQFEKRLDKAQEIPKSNPSASEIR
jgi:hypothetical protein